MSGHDAALVILTDSLKNLLKKDVLSKPFIFSKSSSSSQEHIKRYCQFVQATSEIDKAIILWDSLDDSINNEIIFEADYDAKKKISNGCVAS